MKLILKKKKKKRVPNQSLNSQFDHNLNGLKEFNKRRFFFGHLKLRIFNPIRFHCLDLVYLQYIFYWICHFILNIQWQVIVGFNLYLLFSQQMMWHPSLKQKEIYFYKVLEVSQTLNGMFGWEILRSMKKKKKKRKWERKHLW